MIGWNFADNHPHYPTITICESPHCFVGYGFIAPKTDTGRIICIFYCIFGIPVNMLAIVNLGLWFARQVRKIHRACVKLRNENIDESAIQEVHLGLFIYSLLLFFSAPSCLTGILTGEKKSWNYCLSTNQPLIGRYHKPFTIRRHPVGFLARTKRHLPPN